MPYGASAIGKGSEDQLGASGQRPRDLAPVPSSPSMSATDLSNPPQLQAPTFEPVSKETVTNGDFHPSSDPMESPAKPIAPQGGDGTSTTLQQEGTNDDDLYSKPSRGNDAIAQAEREAAETE